MSNKEKADLFVKTYQRVRSDHNVDRECKFRREQMLTQEGTS